MNTNNLKDFYQIERKVRMFPFIIDIIKGFAFYALIFFVLLSLELFLYLSPLFKILFFSLFFGSALFYFITKYYYFYKKRIYSDPKNRNKSTNKLFEIIKNTFQLIDLQKQKSYSAELVSLAVDERKVFAAHEMNEESFVKDKKKNQKWALIFLLLALFVIFIPFVSKPYQEAAIRSINMTSSYQKPLPYSIQLKNQDLSVYRNENLTLEVKLSGQDYPSEISININGNKSKLKKEKADFFTYQLTNIRQNLSFTIETSNYISEVYQVTVIDKPKILHYKITAHYPAYLNRDKELFENINYFNIPVGTTLNFEFLAENTDEFKISNPNGTILLTHINNVYKFKLPVVQNTQFSAFSTNNNSAFIDSLNIDIKVIDDEYPSVFLRAFQDSLYENVIYLIGQANDDYGLTKATIVVDVFQSESDKGTSKTINIPFGNSPTMFNISEVINLYNFMEALPRRIELYVEIYDNDKLRGFKKSNSQKHIFIFKTDEEKKMEAEQRQNKQMNSLSDLSNQAEQMDKKLEDLKNMLKTQLNKDWKTQQKIEELKKQYEDLKKQVDQLDKEMQQNPLQKEKSDAEKEIEKMLQEMLNKELESMFKEFDKMLNENKADKIMEQLENIKQENKSLKENVDKNLEDFKQQAFEEKLDEALEKIDEIIEKQEKLNKEELNKQTKDKISEKQEAIQKEFKEFSQEMEKLRQMNKELERPNSFMETKPQEQSIDQEMQDAQENMDDSKTGKAKKNQQNAEDQMKDLQEKLQKNKEQMEEENLDEDIEATRELLKNLIRISFQQEELMKNVQRTRAIDPAFNDFIRSQKSLEQQYKILGDTLKALAKRQPMVKSFVLKEYGMIESNLNGLTDFMVDKKIGETAKRQQFIMTSTNNLALMLAESLKNMRNQKSKGSSSSSKKKSDSECDSEGNKKKPNKGKPKMPDIKKLQEMLSEQIKQGGKKLEQGQGQKMSEELARMAAQQEAIRRMLQEYLDQLKQEGQGLDGKIERLMKEMELNEKDIVNRNINQNTLNRLRQIETRLLESEKAELEREKEERRESTEAKDLIPNNIDLLKNIELHKRNQQELLKQNPIKLKNYYRENVSKYFLNFEDHK